MKRSSHQSFIGLVTLFVLGTALLASNTQISSITFPPSTPQLIYQEKSWSAPTLDTELTELRAVTDIYASRKTSNEGLLLFGAGFQRSLTDFDSHNDLLESPYTKSDTLRLSGKFQSDATNQWGSYALGSLDLGTSNQANLSDGYSMIASAGASYALNPKLKFSIGLLTTRNFLNQSLAMPIIGIDWNITDRLKLRTFNGAFLTYDLGKSTQMDLSLQYRDQSFEVENMQGTMFMKMDHNGASIIEESSVVGVLGVRHSWKDVFSIRAFAEIVGNRDFEIVLDEEDIQSIPQIDNSLSFGVEGGIRF